MKKSTQKTLMALFIVFIFGMSSVAYVFYYIGGPTQQEISPLENYVVNGEISPAVENAYIQGGYTFLKVYYNNRTDPSVISFADNAPNLFTTSADQVQVISQKIPSDRDYVRIVNYNIERVLEDLSVENLTIEMCSSILMQSTECVLMFINASP